MSAARAIAHHQFYPRLLTLLASAKIERGLCEDGAVSTPERPQADGSVRVQFNTKGPAQQDPGLGDRFSQAYDRRMGL